MEFDREVRENPNWQFMGKLQDVTVVNENSQVFSFVKTNTTFFVIEGLIKGVMHIGQAVKFSKRDNAVKIGPLLAYRPLETVDD